jgi:spore coat polysaccharide biosynthesis protein SpsF
VKRVIIVQARMTSTRLPGKVLADLGGRPLLAQMLRRLMRCRRADEVVVATTTNAPDDAVVEVAGVEGARWFRGEEHDVLSRYLGAAREARADVIVRVTADCPLIDPEQVDRVIVALETDAGGADYAANVVERTFPRGLDAEALYRDTLQRIDRLAHSAAAREHVTHLVRERRDLFIVRSVTDRQDNSDLRWTVDATVDLVMMRRLYEALSLGHRPLDYPRILAYVRSHPEISAINAHVEQAVPRA